MIIWGGAYHSGGPPVYFNTGGKYDPSTNSWTATNTPSAPLARELHTAVWTGNEMVIWGGERLGSYLNTGGRYNPTTDTWAATSTSNAPSPRSLHTGVWTATEMIVWGGSNSGGYLNTGGRYNPTTGTWIATSTSNAPSARKFHTSVWCGSEMITWGGGDSAGYSNTGGRYNPTTDTWAATSTINSPSGRWLHTAVWTASEMVVWGGNNNTSFSLNTGGRYGPTPAAMCPPTPTVRQPRPGGRYLHRGRVPRFPLRHHARSFTMKTKHTPQFGAFSLQLILCSAAVCSMITGTLLAFFHPEALAKASHPAAAGLTFAERVAYQRAIEEVYWRHRIWPKERPDSKPSLDAVMSHAQLEKKVEDYLRKSQALEYYWHQPITAGQLQAEMDRMAQHTKQPEVLRELFEALGNDPFVVAECLTRPILTERLVTDPTVVAGASPAPEACSQPTRLPLQKTSSMRQIWTKLHTLFQKLIRVRMTRGQPPASRARPMAECSPRQCGLAVK